MATATASTIGKRKREDKTAPRSKKAREAQQQQKNGTHPQVMENASLPDFDIRSTGAGVPPTTAPAAPASTLGDLVHVQIVTGSYERVLHGVSASIPRNLLRPQQASGQADTSVTFSDTFLFAAHASSIRCLAISPPTEADKRFLATGSSDERINLYSVSTAPPRPNGKKSTPTVPAVAISENPRNKSLGSLIHHDRAITRLSFPSKAKLFSSAEDNTIAISRTRDWTVLSSIKAPIPKPQGRPSGDTAGPGEVPAGVNDFAIHPSQKLMLSVGRGEKWLRLWNLMTGKKAGVLNFDRNLLAQVGESKFSSGEGRRVHWDAEGESYVVGFERGAAVFGLDSKPRAVLKPSPPTKFHQMRMLRANNVDLFAVSTEDGRVCFYDLSDIRDVDATKTLPQCPCRAQLGGPDANVKNRIKDFDILTLPGAGLLVITASSDGAIRLWTVADAAALSTKGDKPTQVGVLLGTLDTGNRITCLGAFALDGTASADDLDDGDSTAGAENEDDAEESD
ncbi:WD40 repeat protein [Teratosphaeria destructans]|uniref:WD40 repeat protein n=1 Tax=Teratosphaeria destructans TaxID=418781 RepID=A0A9W7SMK2_9PEZI|nr:WD40 repeat protein [Teratosphaeria destructans]